MREERAQRGTLWERLWGRGSRHARKLWEDDACDLESPPSSLPTDEELLKIYEQLQECCDETECELQAAIGYGRRVIAQKGARRRGPARSGPPARNNTDHGEPLREAH